MASSPVEVSNMALQLVGAKPVASLSEGTKAASLLNQFYNDELDAALRAHAWKFAHARATLTRTSTVPLFDYAYGYQLPTNPYCLRVLRLDEGTPWELEGRLLLTDAATAKIKYTKRVTSPTDWDALFTSAFAARLAARIAYPLTEQQSYVELALKLYGFTLSEARSIDAQEGSTQDGDNSILTDVRRSGASTDRRSGWTMGWS